MLHLNTKTFAAAAIALGLIFSGCDKKTGNAISDSDMSMGSKDAKVTIIEYASVACPICAKFNEDMMPSLKKKYIDSGKVRYVYRPMLTGVASIAASGELLAQCAGKDKYFTVNDAIMRAQNEMYETGENDTNARPVLLRIANSIGMSEAAFNTCIMDPKGLKRVNDLNEKYFKENDIEGTPTFFINGKKFAGNPFKLEEFDKAIEPHLAAK